MANPPESSPAVAKKTAATIFYWLFVVLFVVALGLEIASLFWRLKFPDAISVAFILVAAASTLAAFWRRLPLQNVLLAAFIIAVIGGGFSTLGARTGLPFGPFLFSSGYGPLLFNTLPWAMPLVWVFVVLNSRGTARLILRPWRKNKNYGFQLIGVAALLVLFFDLALEPYAFHVKNYWLWLPSASKVTWQGISPMSFFAWALVAALILFFIAPALIVKKPRSKRGPDPHSLCLWLGAILLFAIGCAVNRIWVPVFIDAAIGITVAIFGIRGAMW
jgi:putative membrane protein